MSTKRVDGVVVFNCDGRPRCRVNFEGESEDFRTAWQEAREAGWVNAVSYPRGAETWEHYCPRCKSQVGD